MWLGESPVGLMNTSLGGVRGRIEKLQVTPRITLKANLIP
jgi:hypothetical protein